MRGKQLSIYLAEPEIRALVDLSIRECRKPNDQARYILRQALSLSDIDPIQDTSFGADSLLTTNEFNKLQVYGCRLIDILERDGTVDQFRGSTDYLLRSAIEALGLQGLFYDAPAE